MGRRARSNSNASAQIQQTNTRNAHLTQLRALTTNSPHPTVGGMSPSSRYNHNLKVLRRRDPSIVSIFDQFSHVCLYHHNGEKWEKKGYEGSMFLYERDAYPPYGFYILNRMGMDDYIQRMYPEDDMNILGDYLMYKCYPDYTGLRLGLPMDNHRGIDPDLKNDKRKGRAITVGLWMFATESREPMKDVMMRLHDFIGREIRYPDEYRYGPDRPPPPNPHLRISNDSSPEDEEETSADSSNASVFQGNGMTEIDKLFAKFVPGQAPPGHAKPTSVDSLFAAVLSSGEPLQSPSPGPRASSTVSNRGIALLDSIFASATPTPPPQVPASIHILSPKPTSTILPQVLNQNVISTLLGLAPSPGGSVSSSGYRYEGDNESTSEDGGFSEGEHPKSRKVLDEELEQATSSDRVPSFTFDNLTALDDNMSSPPAVQGDVTPRPALKFMQPPTDLSPSRKREQQRELLYPIHRRDDVIDSTPPSESSSSGRQLLKSFEPEEELWPYPRAPLDDRALDMDGEVVELDFNEISALSDPHIFEAKVYAKGKKRKDKKKDKEDIEDTAVVAIPQRPTPAKGKGKMVVEQPVVHAKNGVAMGLDRDAVTESLLAAASPSLQHGARNRNEFVREVLTLIHTDKGFVDNLWAEYLVRNNTY